MPDERKALLLTDDWAGRHETPVLVVGETPKRYRIRAADHFGVKLGGRQRWLRSGTTLVPKTAIRFTEEPADAR